MRRSLPPADPPDPDIRPAGPSHEDFAAALALVQRLCASDDGRRWLARVLDAADAAFLAQRQLAYRRAFVSAVSDNDLQKLARVMFERASGGDLDAARLLFSYGRPRLNIPL